MAEAVIYVRDGCHLCHRAREVLEAIARDCSLTIREQDVDQDAILRDRFGLTVPVIEIDAGREIDVVVTKGVRIDAPVTARTRPASNLAALRRLPEARYWKESSDEDY